MLKKINAYDTYVCFILSGINVRTRAPSFSILAKPDIGTGSAIFASLSPYHVCDARSGRIRTYPAQLGEQALMQIQNGDNKNAARGLRSRLLKALEWRRTARDDAKQGKIPRSNGKTCNGRRNPANKNGTLSGLGVSLQQV